PLQHGQVRDIDGLDFFIPFARMTNNPRQREDDVFHHLPAASRADLVYEFLNTAHVQLRQRDLSKLGNDLRSQVTLCSLYAARLSVANYQLTIIALEIVQRSCG